MKIWMIAACVAVCLGGCAQYESGRSNAIVRASYDATDTLLKGLKPELPKDAPIIVASFVELDHLGTSSTLGRMLADQVSARMTQHGFPVEEIRLGSKMVVKDGLGELLLTRELKELSTQRKAQAVVVGTYVVAPEKVFLNLKLIRPIDNRILAAHDLALESDDTVQALLMK
ncbi:hypothetical protein KSF73_11225 [Burkholderiaceae bacterium DAT-1]|nr:hypothetical protein [Burkholderiaceae bacterium DAT-1]